MSPDPAPRTIVANLDAEAELSGQKLPRRARHTAAAFGTLLRVLARPGDLLYLPAPVDAERMVEVPGLPRPILRHGEHRKSKHTTPEFSRAGPPNPLLAWCETPRVAALRRPSPPTPPFSPDLPLHEMLWHLKPSSPEAVTTIHHRAFHLRMARRLGCALPGARLLHSCSELEDHLEAGGAQESTVGAWVLKAPFSAAGRGRFPGTGPRLDAATRRRLEGQFARFGELLFEPWMERTLDFGMAGVLTPEGPIFLGSHRQLVNHRGVFQGIEFSIDEEGIQDLDPTASRQLRWTFDQIAQALIELGFRGPFGLDGWCYQNTEGGSTLHPLGEVNARLTFGIVARLLAERLRSSLELVPGQHLRLLLGRASGAPGAVLSPRAALFRAGTSWSLLEPDAKGNGAATLEIGPKDSDRAPVRTTPTLRHRPSG